MSDVYVSREACGCVGLLVVDGADAQTGRYVAAAIRRGEAVERMAVEAARATPLRCETHRRPARRQEALL